MPVPKAQTVTPVAPLQAAVTVDMTCVATAVDTVAASVQTVGSSVSSAVQTVGSDMTAAVQGMNVSMTSAVYGVGDSISSALASSQTAMATNMSDFGASLNATTLLGLDTVSTSILDGMGAFTAQLQTEAANELAGKNAVDVGNIGAFAANLDASLNFRDMLGQMYSSGQNGFTGDGTIKKGDPSKNIPQQTPMSNPTDLAAADAIADEDDAGRFELLRTYGINPLRVMVLAAAEFIPLGTGPVDMYQTVINLNFGEESSVSVTQVAKLIEIHRMIREYSIQTANSLIHDFYGPITHPDFLALLRQRIPSALTTSYDASLSITQIIEKAHGHFMGQSFDSTERALIAAASTNSVLMKAIIEYFAYDNLFIALISYLEDLMNLKIELIKTMKLTNLTKDWKASDNNSGYNASKAYIDRDITA
jgi:hypothetical protein